jgi:enoyl-CoA hydratase
MMSDVVLFEARDGLGLITINRPKALNALNSAVLAGLAGRLDEAEATPGLRVVVITGAGKAFVAGADIAQMREFTSVEAETFAGRGQQLMERIAAFQVPVIAAVNGFALGGGLELALACDLVLAGEKARFGLPEVKLGVIPGFAGTYRLQRRVGIAVALDLTLTGRMIDADEAVRVGIASRKLDGNPLQEAMKVAATIAANGPVACRLAKRAIRENADSAAGAALAAERSLFGLCFSTADQTEGMSAFVEKRKAAFTGR